MHLRQLIGSGDRIMLATLPFAIAGVALNVANPAVFVVGGPPAWLGWLAAGALGIGVILWLWAVVLVLRDVPQGRLITGGPYALVRHPIYTAVALLVLPGAGLLLNTWVGIPIGIAMYVATRWFAPAEEAALSRSFGRAWADYTHHVHLGWL